MSPLSKAVLLIAYELSAHGSLPDLFKVVALDVPKALTDAIERESEAGSAPQGAA